ncbi:MAG: polysaccharide deacetylase family protein [Betaproteobacteria bacterium]|nr:polysaccharide deacetylase family protein [Betaproteobacteria bacterium]
MESVSWQWPGGKKIAVVFNVAFEAWSDGKAPGISPMGNPLPAIPGIVDSMAISWAAYGAKRGIYRLLDAFARHNVRASVMTSAILAERSPEAVRAVGDGGHEVVSHSYAMDVMPVMMSVEEERLNIERCTDLLAHASRSRVRGWISPRGTPSPNTARLLSEVDYLWYGDVFDDDLPYVQTFGESRIVALPLSMDVNDMRSMKYGDPPRAMLETFEEHLARITKREREPVIVDATVHAHIFGRPHGAHYYERIVEIAANTPEIWVATREQIANHMLALK